MNLEEIAELVPDNVTGADLYSLCSNAWFSALRKSVSLVEAGVLKEIFQFFKAPVEEKVLKFRVLLLYSLQF